MNLGEIEKLTEDGENIQTEKEQKEKLAPTPSSGRNKPKFIYDDVIDKFRSFYIQPDLIYLTGSVVTQGMGADVDIVIRNNSMPDLWKEAIAFRLYRWFSDAYDIPYDKTSEYLHIHFGK